ncbi:hypothetical protein ACFL1E_01740 [Candidatus Omnitrophota bacterium]
MKPRRQAESDWFTQITADETMQEITDICDQLFMQSVSICVRMSQLSMLNKQKPWRRKDV